MFQPDHIHALETVCDSGIDALQILPSMLASLVKSWT